MEEKNGIRAVIFDLGNVLVDFDHRIAAKRISAFTDQKGEEIYNLFFDSEVTGLFEEGKISPLEFYQKVKQSLSLRLDYNSFALIWNEIFFFSRKNKEVFSLANNLRARYKVVVLSNINFLHLEYLKKNFPVFGPFHNIFTSCELGLRKPDHLIYKKVLENIGVPAQDCFYTDDRKELIESAMALGLNASVFSGIEQLKADLLSQGIEIS